MEINKDSDRIVVPPDQYLLRSGVPFRQLTLLVESRRVLVCPVCSKFFNTLESMAGHFVEHSSVMQIENMPVVVTLQKV